MINYKIMIVIFIAFMFIGGVNGLEMLEPIYKDLSFNKTIEIGTVAPGGYFLVSFMNLNENFEQLVIPENYKNIATISETNKTNESIFGAIYINKEVEGLQEIKLQLIGETIDEIVIKMNVVKNSFSVIIEPYEQYTRYGTIKTINYTIVNHSISSQEIIINSNLSEHFYNKQNKKNKILLLQPNQILKENYSFVYVPSGQQNIELYFKTNIDGEEKISKTIDLMLIKDIKSVFGKLNSDFTLYGFNVLPIYFLNKILYSLI